MPRRDDVRRVGQPRPRRVDPRSSTARSTRGSTSSTPPTCTRAGESEEIVGKALAGGRRDDVVLATKVHGADGRRPQPARQLAPLDHRSEVENSLRRLQTDWIDLYQIHRPEPGHRHRRDARRAHRPRARRARSATSARSTFPAAQIVEAQWVAERARPRALRLRAAAVLDARPRRSRRDVLPVCERYGMGVIPWSPLAGGWLSGPLPQGRRAAGLEHAAAASSRALRPVRLPENQRKLDAADALAGWPRRPGMHAHRPGARVRHPPPGRHRGDHRPAHDGAARVASSAPPT